MKSAAADTFVPFEPATPAHASPTPGGPRLKVVPKSEGRPDFAPLQDLASQGPVSPASAGTSSPHAHGPASPIVTLQRDGDRVTGIRIECTCGQVIELACSA